jgi:peptidoglycan/LPS O-acetylase OafA/YrhL
MALETRLKSLDGLRAVAVAQVVTYHYYFMPGPTAVWPAWMERALASVDGVMLFFALSGYLIGGILLSVRDRAEMAKVFYLRRCFRILPLYLVLLASYLAIRAIDGHFRHGLISYWYSDVPLWNYLTFTQNIRMQRDGVMGAMWLMVTWSLAVEQQFYLVMPWLVRWLGRNALLLVVVAVFGAATLSLDSRHYLLPDRVEALAAGLGLAILARSPWFQERLARWRRGLRVAVVVYFIGIIALFIAFPAVDRMAGHPLAALVYALLVHLLAEDAPWPVVKPVLAWLAPLGLLSYFIYLFHFPVIYLTWIFIAQSPLVALAVTTGLAAVSYRWFERPLIEYGHRFRYGTPQSGPAPTAPIAPAATPLVP